MGKPRQGPRQRGDGGHVDRERVAAPATRDHLPPVPGGEPAAPRGCYSLEIGGTGGRAGGATTTIEQEPPGEGETPAKVPASAATAGTSIGNAWPPLQGATSYAASLASASSDNWYILFKRPDSNQATIRLQDTTVAGSTTCASISAALYNTDGTGGPLSRPTLGDNHALTFTVPGSESADPQGRYYLEIQGTGCPPAGPTSTIA